jgi:Tfp pilus assembly protein PilV
MLMNVRTNKLGASILEAMIAAFILSIAALAYGKLQTVSFSNIYTNQRLEQVTYVMSDFSEKMRANIAYRMDPADRAGVEAAYLNTVFNIPVVTCNNEPNYIGDCMNTDLGEPTICDLGKNILFDVYEMACGTYQVASLTTFSLTACANNAEAFCLVANLDGVARNQALCRANPRVCVQLEINLGDGT